MFSPFNKNNDYKRIKRAFSKITKLSEIIKPKFNLLYPERKMSIRDALLKNSETVNVENAEGRILSKTNISCPPAIPIMFGGEVIDKNAIEIMKYNQIKKVKVVIE